MPFRFRRSLRVLPGIRINLGKSGASVSMGVRGAHVTLRPGHTPRATVGIPGTGLSYTEGGEASRKTAVEAPGDARSVTYAEASQEGSAWGTWLCVGLIVAAVVVLIVSASGCATAVAPGAESVRVATAAQKEKLCESVKVISVEQRLGPNKPGNAMTKALNAVAAAGGNGIYIVSSSTDWAEGASVTAEALRCRW